VDRTDSARFMLPAPKPDEIRARTRSPRHRRKPAWMPAQRLPAAQDGSPQEAGAIARSRRPGGPPRASRNPRPSVPTAAGRMPASFGTSGLVCVSRRTRRRRAARPIVHRSASPDPSAGSPSP
jgi:hypothetical protein